MERRFAARRDQLLADAEVDPRIPRGVLSRLGRFLDPFVELLQRSEQGGHAHTYAAGLVSGLKYKNVESIAYLHDQRARAAPAVHRPVALGPPTPGSPSWPARWARSWARPTGCWSWTPRPSPRRGPNRSACSGSGAAGWARSTTARSASTSPTSVAREHALVDVRLYLPKEWAGDASGGGRPGSPRRSASARGTSWPWRCSTNAARRCRTPGSPATTRWAAARGSARIAVAGRVLLAGRAVQHRRCGTCSPPTRRTRAGAAGRDMPFTPRGSLVRGLPEAAWQTIEVRAGEKGPVEVQAVWTLVQARTEGRASDVAEVLVVFRERQGDGTWKHDYLLSNASLATPLAEYARVFKAEHRIEECLQRAKGEAGLADYEVRTWRGLASPSGPGAGGDVVPDDRRRVAGKKMDAGVDGSAVAGADRGGVGAAAGNGAVGVPASHREPAFTTH